MIISLSWECLCDKVFFLLDVPNAGEGLKRLDYRQGWDVDLRAYLKNLDSKKPLVLCGDLNVAHNEIGEGERERGREGEGEGEREIGEGEREGGR